MAAKQPTAPTIEPMLSMDDLASMLRVSRRKVERMRAAGTFPRPSLTLASRCVGRPNGNSRAWIDGQAEQGKGA